ncbi:MAG: ISNCY family transposase [Nitrosopumilus sp.]
MAQLITMSSKELSKGQVIEKLIRKEINGMQAANQLRLTTRQVRRLKNKVKQHGIKALAHGNRGKASNHKMPDDKIERIKDIVGKQYQDFGPTFASEKLEENHQINIGKEKLRQLMIEWKFWRPRPRKRNGEYRNWRPRKEHYGEMEQFDGSYHKWFENRAPECCLLASIDDADGEITKGEFTASEGVIPVFGFWQGYVIEKGKPLKIYLDRYSTYKINAKHLLDDPKAITQFERAMKDLDIEVIHANSCQGKGRVERLFGTLQDRLVKELRLNNISTIKKANKFLNEIFIPKFNEKFSVASQKKANFHKKLTKIDKANLDKIFSIQDTRIVNNDFTINYKTKWYQLDKTQPTLVCRKDKVSVEKRLNNSIKINLRNKYLNFQELSERPKKIKMKVTALTKTAPTWKPPLDHPWRRQQFIFENKLKVGVKNEATESFLRGEKI